MQRDAHVRASLHSDYRGNALGMPDQIRGLETQCGSIRERLSKIEGRLETPARDRSAHPLLVAIVTALIAYLAWLGVQIFNQGKAIAHIQTVLSPQIIQDAASRATNPQSAKEASKALHMAIAHGNRVDPKVVSDAGEKFVAAAPVNPAAWGTAIEFANYRTTFNFFNRTAALRPFAPGEESRGLAAEFWDTPVPGKPKPALAYVVAESPTVPAAAAWMINMGGDPTEQLKFGAVYMILTGNAISIDDSNYRHVVLQNVEVHYSGKPMMLEDVIFVNCTFVFENTAPARKLVDDLLVASSINFNETSG